MTRKRYTAAEVDEARATLRELAPPGTEVYTVLRHVSRSGMLRRIDPCVMTEDGPRWLTYSACVVLDEPPQYAGDGIRIGGAGMDMGFALVYNLSSVLYPDGFGCVGERCPSNDHSNGDRDYTPHGHRGPQYDGTRDSLKHWHRAGAYALRHRWL